MTRGIGIAVVSAVAALAAQQLKLSPVDEAASDPGFLAFRTQLQRAIDRRDVKFLRSAISPDIELGGEGEQQGPEDFEQVWRPGDPSSDLWDTLDDVLALGGSFQEHGRRFCAPYVYSNWPEAVSPADALAVITKGVNLRQSCAANARVVTVLDHDIVTWSGAHETITRAGKEWAEVKTAGGIAGCVLDEYVRSPLDYHACFEKIQGKWKLTALMEGE